LRSRAGTEPIPSQQKSSQQIRAATPRLALVGHAAKQKRKSRRSLRKAAGRREERSQTSRDVMEYRKQPQMLGISIHLLKRCSGPW